MRRLFFQLVTVAGAAALSLSLGLTLVGCPAAHDSFPTKACSPGRTRGDGSNPDCYVGELCNPTSMMCELPAADMSVPDDIPRFDFTMFTPDLSDGGATDSGTGADL